MQTNITSSSGFGFNIPDTPGTNGYLSVYYWCTRKQSWDYLGEGNEGLKELKVGDIFVTVNSDGYDPSPNGGACICLREFSVERGNNVRIVQCDMSEFIETVGWPNSSCGKHSKWQA